MVLEYCAGGSLATALADPKLRLTWERHRLPIALGVARAMAYLHSQEPPVLHRDLKPDNILLDTTRAEPKVADFGLSKELQDDATMSVAGTPLFSAPEMLRHERYGAAADVWSYACVLCCLSTCSARPYRRSGSNDEVRLVAEGQLRPRTEGIFAEVVERCAKAASDERPSFTDLLELLEAPDMVAGASTHDDASYPSTRGKQLLYQSSKATVQLDSRLTGCKYDLFLSHGWANSQDVAKVIQIRIQELLPPCRVFLDLDNLDDVQRHGQNTRLGSNMGPPTAAQVQRLEQYVADTAVVLCIVADGYFESKNSMRELRKAVQCGKPLICVLETSRNQGALTMDNARRRASALDASFAGWRLGDGPSAADVCASLFARPCVMWERAAEFQAVSLRLIAEVVLPRLQGLVRAPAELTFEEVVDQLAPPPRLCLHHLFVSTHNPGAAEVVQELISRHAGAAALRTTSNAVELGEAAFVLLYLNRDTWVPRASGEEALLQAEVAEALTQGVPLLLVHECDHDKGGMSFDEVIASTPQPLRDAQVYSTIAVPLKSGQYRPTSLFLIFRALVGACQEVAAASTEAASVLTASTSGGMSGIPEASDAPAWSLQEALQSQMVRDLAMASGVKSRRRSSISVEAAGGPELLRDALTPQVVANEPQEGWGPRALYAVGGCNADSVTTADVDVFDGTSNTWSGAAPMGTARREFGVALLGGKLYAVGGQGQDRLDLATVEALDPQAGRWAAVAPTLIARAAPAVAALDGKLYAIGGLNKAARQSAEVFDPRTGAWAAVAPMAAGRFAAGAAVLDGRIYVAGGTCVGRSFLSSMEIYDPVGNTWAATAPMATARAGFGMAAVGGKIYAVGGNDSGFTSLSSVEAYDPQLNAWSAVASMSTARSDLGLTVMRGKLYAVGGCSGDGMDGALATAEAYDPHEDRWEAVAPMASSLCCHALAPI